MYRFFFIVIFILISGCAARQQENNGLADSLKTQQPQLVLNRLQEYDPAPRDFVQYHLNLGFLQFITGDFKAAIASLTSAKQEMGVLEASSISENIAAGTISEILRSYSGYPIDRVMVHNMLALSYLFNNDIDAARVEILQADLAMKKLAAVESLHGQLASSHLLAGIIYELLDEQSDALISYRNAADIIEQRRFALPLGLKQALLRMSFKLRATEQYLKYQKQFPELPLPDDSRKNQLFAIYFEGVVSHKQQHSIMVPDHNNEQLIRISMPTYPPLNKSPGCAKISQIKTEVIEDLELLVREDLEKEYPSILLLTATRAIAKHELVKKAEKQDPVLAALVNIATVLSEEADLRSWNMLPSTIQFAYLEMEPSAKEVTINRCNTRFQTTFFDEYSKNILLINSLSEQIFHYQHE